MREAFPLDSLRSKLAYEPQELRFGTSGRRGELVHLSQLEIYLNALAELEYLQSLPRSRGGIARGEAFYFAYDLRPSSTRYVPEQQGRGEIAQAIERAICDAGMQAVNLGAIPTPALTHFALSHGKGGIMVTGSHIPFDWNGYKTNSARGELLKDDEGPINERVRQVRQRLYDQKYADSLFEAQGHFKNGHRALPPATDAARSAYLKRYLGFFEATALAGSRLLVYQHSAVGRDILVEVLERLGAIVIPAGRSDAFIPIDTENIDNAQIAAIQSLADAAARHGPLCAAVSTDGDSDRPIVLAADPRTGRLRFFGGDLLGMIVAEYLRADAVVVPISTNDAIDRGNLRERVAPKTRIGSPYVTAGMEQARVKGARLVCGWEANGGFLLGSDIERNGRVLKALPTRDALLPILCVLCAAQEARISVADLFARLPRRFSRATLLKRFPRPIGRQIVERFSPADKSIREVAFKSGRLIITDEMRNELLLSNARVQEVESIRRELENYFTQDLGFGKVAHLNYTDGVRITFSNGDVAHFRPSGNADEFRIYALADSEARADAIVRTGVAEPDGILRKMEKALAASRSRPPAGTS